MTRIVAGLAVLLSSAGLAFADGEGTATIEPGPYAVAGSRGTWTITYRPGPEGLKPLGGIRLPLSGFPIRLFAKPQCTDPQGANYTTARCTNAQVTATARFSDQLRGGWMQMEEVQVTVGARGMSADDALIVVYGDTSGGGPGGSVRGAEGDGLPIRMSSDADGDGRYAPLAKFPRLTLVGGPAARLVAFAPSQAVVGKPVTVAVSIRDDRNAVATQSLPEVELTGPDVAEPVKLTFEEGRRAVAPAQVTFAKPGVHRLTVKALGAGSELTRIDAGKFVSVNHPAEGDAGFAPELESVEVSALAARPGSTLRVIAHWRNAGTAPPREYRVMCHLQRRPAAGRALANWDHAPAVPTTDWQPSKQYESERIGAIPSDIAPGEHALVVGLYYSPEPGKFVVPITCDVAMVRVGPDEPLVTDVQPALSNPIQVLTDEPKPRLLWGDLHCHTEDSGDGSGMVEALYQYARDTARLDFCACSDHVSPNYPEDQWRQIQELAERFDEPGRFVSILGYEWSNAEHGDKNVYFRQDYEPIRVPESGECEDLWKMLTGVDCVVIPHHPAYPVGLRGTDWTRIDSSLVPVVEMCSTHGLGEYLGNPRPYGNNKPMGPSLPGGFAQDALARGLRLGFICSSDDHSAHAGKVGFLVAVYADSFDREGILNALRARRCYGTTGARILIDVTANGQPMGSLLRADKPPKLAVRIEGTAPLQMVEVVKDGRVCYSTQPKQDPCAFEFMAPDLDRAESYYYVRVTQTDGELGWSSPIFVENTGPLPRLAVGEVAATPEPKAGEVSRVSAVIRNEGRAASQPAEVWFMLDGPPAVPVKRENPPAKSGIGGLMATPGLQVWRWPVDETSVNVFIRWGGDDAARGCVGEVHILDAQGYYFTPFHVEDDDKLEDDGAGCIRWSTNAERGTGDGLNLWVRIDPRKPTRLSLTATRGGQPRPEEVFTHLGKPTALPVEIPLVDYDATRWIGEAALPTIKAHEEREVEVKWKPERVREGKLVCEVVKE
jgi:hypothetical protein